MSNLPMLSEAQMRRIEPYFPLSHGVPRVDDRRVLSGIIYVIKNGLRWCDAPSGYGPNKTLYSRFVRWSKLGVFSRIFAALVKQAGEPDVLMIDATHLKAHRTASSLFKKGLYPDVSGAPKGGLNSKLHAVCDGEGRPLALCLTEGQMSDHKGAKLLYPALPDRPCVMIGDKGYDSDEYRAALKAKGITPCIPPRKGRTMPASFDKQLYRQRHKVENLFARLKDWRRIHTRYDRRADTYMAAITIAAICAFWIN